MLPILCHEVNLTANFIPVCIVDTQEEICDYSESHPRQLQVLLDPLVLSVRVLDDGQADIQKGDRAQDADQAHKVNRGKPHTERESQCVEELDLDKGALSIEVKFDDAHGVHKNNEAEDQDVAALVLHAFYHVDGAQAEQDLEKLEISGLNLRALCIRSCHCCSHGQQITSFQHRIDRLKDHQEKEQDDRCPQLRQTTLSLL